jgi:phosphoglycerate dehydrogenase-like enzyme
MDVVAHTAGPRTTPESKRDHGYIVPGTGDPDGSLPSAWYHGVDKESLHKFLGADIDILLVAVPLTPETRYSLGAEEFKILGKQNSFIINIARGSVIVTADLIAALKKTQEDGGLRGAALDVTDPEPLPADSELWDLPNVAITPHLSGLSTVYADRSFAILDANLDRLEAGKDLINVVDRKKAY